MLPSLRLLNLLSLKSLGIAAVLALGFATPSAQAQPRIAFVDMRKVFEGYYKTEVANEEIKKEVDKLNLGREDMMKDYEKANEEYRGLLDSASDPALSAEEKQRRQKAAEDKLRDIRQLEQQVQQHQNASQKTIVTKRQRMREQILREIREIVVTKAKAAGYTLVLDSAAESFNQTPIVLYTNGDNDLTDDILKQLNASAPPARQ